MPGQVNVALRWARAGSAPAITSPAFLVAGTVNSVYPTTTFTATGTDPITWSHTGTLPAGMTFSSGGVLAGTPTATSSGSLTFTATNAFGSDSRALTLTVNAAGSLPLLYEANVTGTGRYLGAFKVPSDGGQANPNNWSGSNTGESGAYVAYNSVSGTLFITGRNVGGNANIAEISIPSSLDVTGVPANMPTASWVGASLSLPRFFDITNGNRNQSITTPNSGFVASGIFTDGANVYQNFEGSYDSTGETLTPLWKRAGLTLTSGAVTGPISFNTSKTQRTFAGAMCTVPSAYVSSLGGDILQADKQWSINGTQNEGPFLASYNSSQIGSVSPLPTTVLCDYQFPLPTQSQWTKSQSTSTQGLAFPTGTRSVLQIGIAGKGTAQYGDPLVPADGIYDPANSDKGWHAYPYKWHIWAYDADDLAAVKAGTKASNTVLCYADWDVIMPPNVGVSSRIVSGSCYDDVNKRLFITECGYARAGSLQPIIHVFQVTF